MTSTTPPSQPPRRLSIVIPVYNEEAGLAPLFARLYPALDQLGESYEVIFVNDGSRDRSVALLREQFQKRPDVTRVVLFSGNYGQHMAIMAGFAQCRGERVVTLDADLQNPPEEITKLIDKAKEGNFDVVYSYYQRKKHSLFRNLGSGSGLCGGNWNLNYDDDGAFGVSSTSTEGAKSAKNLDISVKQAEKYAKIIQGVRKGDLPASQLEEVLRYFSKQ